MAGYSAINQGHCHPRIKQAAIEQMNKVTLTSRAFHTDQLGPYSQKLVEMMDHDRVIFCNGGVEGSECAVKFARRWGYEVKNIESNKARVLFAKQNFWGRSLAACASSDDPDRYRNFGPFDGMGFDLVAYNDPAALEEKLKNEPNYAAFMIEPIQGEGGVIVPDHGYLKKCKEICEKYNVLLIFDEIQTGLGRTGKMLAQNWEDVKPDITVLGKSLSGGFYPISACMTNNEVMDCIRPNEHGSTFGGNPLACAIGTAALDTIVEEGMVENASKVGKYLEKRLKEVQAAHDQVVDVRGRGMFYGVE